MRKKIFAAVALAMFLFSAGTAMAAREYQVGVSPLALDLGEIKPGEEKVENFYIVTESTEDLLIGFDATRGLPDFFKKPEYSQLISAYSEEDVTPWIVFPSNPVVLSPQKDPLNTPVGQVFGWRRVNFEIKVPKGAEPGYHTVSIRPAPYVASGRSLGVNIVAISAITVLFKVPGVAERSGQALDITPERYDSAGAKLSVFFKNTGTVTISAYASSLDIFNSTGNKMGSGISGTYYVKPGKTESISVDIGPKIPEGTYDVSATVQYVTGSSTKNSEVTLSTKASAASSPKTAAPRSSLPWWAFMLPILLFLLVMYMRRKDADGKGYKV